MLQCAGCGRVVSEFAARCPACGQTTDDALDIAEPPAESAPHLPTSTPAEQVAIPVSAGHWSVGQLLGRWSVAATAVVVVASVSAALLLSSSRSGAPSALKRLGGQVLAVSPTGAVVSVDPASGRRKQFPVLNSGPLMPTAFSADGRTVLDTAGTVFNIEGTGIVAGSNAVSRVLSTATLPAPSMPFADDDRAVLVLTRSTAGAPATATVVSLADGRESDLGIVDTAGGDFQSTGAFVSVPAQLNQPRVAHAAGPDTRVELRVPGQSATTLATAEQLNQDLGSLPTTPVQLGVYPNPTGDAIAVVLDPLTRDDTDVPMVVLNRHGDLLAAFPQRLGPIYGSQPVWSPGGHQLAYPTYSKTGTAVAILTETGTVSDLPAPTPDTTFGSCVWSPTSADVVCQSRTAGTTKWLYAIPTSTSLITAASAGDPLAWVASPPVLSAAELPQT